MKRFLEWLLLGRNAVRNSLSVSLGITLFEVILLLAAALKDQNFWLCNRCLGLFQHFGVPPILVADLGLLALLAVIISRFRQLMRRIPVTEERSNRRFVRLGIRRGLSTLLLQGKALRLFGLLSGLGLLFLALNAYQTTDPVRFYGNDVFDSYGHQYSYYAMRFVLGLSWVVLYPYAAVAIIAISGNIYRVTNTLKKRGRLGYKEFHPDGCVGYSYIGTINFLVVLAILLLCLALGAVIAVHHKLNILQISGVILLTTLFVALSYGISWPVTSFLFRARRAARVSNYRIVHKADRQFAALKLIWIVTERPFSPYSVHQKVVINVARLGAVVFTGFRLFSLL